MFGRPKRNEENYWEIRSMQRLLLLSSRFENFWKSFTVHSTQAVYGTLLWTDTKNTVPYKRNSFLWSHATFHRWMLRLLERFAAQDPSQKRYWLGVKRDLLWSHLSRMSEQLDWISKNKLIRWLSLSAIKCIFLTWLVTKIVGSIKIEFSIWAAYHIWK